MSGKYGALILVAVVAFGGAIWWFSSGTDGIIDRMTRDAETEQSERDQLATEDTEDAEAEAAPSGQGSMRDLLMRGQSMECQFTFSDAEVDGEGTGFFDGERMRMDSMMEIDGSVHHASYIYADDSMYAWGEMPEGSFAITMPVDGEDAIDDFADDADTPVGVDEEVSYECEAWSVDNSVFAPPESVEFMDMGAMMDGMMQGTEGMDQAEMEAMMEQMEGSMPPQQ